MKIAVVSAHYMPEIGYQEVHLAKAYARLGYTVKVFTSAASVNLGGSISRLHYQKGLTKDPKFGYDILRLPSLSYKSKSLPFGLKKAVTTFNPDVLVILGVAKLFPMALLCPSIYHNTKSVSVYGDAKEYLDRNTLKQKLKTLFHELGYRFIKYPLYQKAVRYNHRLVLNIPETNEVFLRFLPKKDVDMFNAKKVMLNLGYDPDDYFYTQKDREEVRQKLNLTDDTIVVITSTRVNKRKNLENIISCISKLHATGKKVAYIIIGCLGDDYEQELKAFIRQQPYPGSFKCFPFLNAAEIRQLYCAADVGLWLKAAISIQEAMGTGLPVILENKPSLSHLIQEGKNGWYFQPETFEKVIERTMTELLQHPVSREDIALHNSTTLSYNAIAQKIINAVITTQHVV